MVISGSFFKRMGERHLHGQHVFISWIEKVFISGKLNKMC